MDVVVNDTNIFVDLHNIGLLDYIFKLPITFHTLSTVMYEITDTKQSERIAPFVKNGDLYVAEMTADEILDVSLLFSKRNNNVSFADCSVWYYAKKHNYRLLTGDKKLRSCAINDGVLVSGVLYLTDMLVSENIISKSAMADKLKELLRTNKRLPKKIIESKIKEYSE